MRIEPLYDNVVIKPLKEEEVTASGIVLPDTVDKEKPMQGEVVAVGPGKRAKNGETVPLTVKVGDRVLFTKYAPDEVEIDDEDYLVLAESKILGIVRSA
ncbi:MAG: co-chaperone GroES [Candidatus Andersenbacteria bacterium CG10_big_fil_rev_8_21_14_0_10_54_11]|uniref:Co-chaperonin GroES n=1 Tax=Candidatus Andersenbacteria bacterium CG10_big_fil_rev_8_21_14_0_10_54_11 TaxID=1974485 RepID=A0A2M6WYM5_9BACT|nr:MAG: co-chaperone GroES [Candidatus Andersenbacteria bacterium CG10_big_fil_rev_8_21_14_0_10_54_11]